MPLLDNDKSSGAKTHKSNWYGLLSSDVLFIDAQLNKAIIKLMAFKRFSNDSHVQIEHTVSIA